MRKQIFSVFTTCVSFTLIPVYAFAQGKVVNPIPKIGDLPTFIDVLLQAFQFVVVPIMVLALIYGGFLFVTAGGNEEKLSMAKRVLLWTLVGAAIIVSARVIAVIIANTASAL